MEGFSWTASFTTLVVILGWVVSVVAFIWSRSGNETVMKVSVARAHERLDLLEKSYMSKLDGIEHEMDVRISAVQASGTLVREQQHEMREVLARNYMTKEEIGQIEKRVTEGQGRLMDRMDRIDERMTAMQDKIIEAIKRGAH